MNANMSLTHNVVSCHLADRCVKIHGGFWRGLGNPFQNSLNVDCGWASRWSREIPSDEALHHLGSPHHIESILA
jgi:hypothetical protein